MPTHFNLALQAEPIARPETTNNAHESLILRTPHLWIAALSSLTLLTLTRHQTAPLPSPCRCRRPRERFSPSKIQPELLSKDA